MPVSRIQQIAPLFISFPITRDEAEKILGISPSQLLQLEESGALDATCCCDLRGKAAEGFYTVYDLCKAISYNQLKGLCTVHPPSLVEIEEVLNEIASDFEDCPNDGLTALVHGVVCSNYYSDTFGRCGHAPKWQGKRTLERVLTSAVIVRCFLNVSKSFLEFFSILQKQENYETLLFGSCALDAFDQGTRTFDLQ